MQNRTVPLSLLMSAALAIPSLAMAVSSDIDDSAAMDMNPASIEAMPQDEAVNPSAELLANQADVVDSNEFEAGTEVAPRDPEMQAAYDEQYSDQNIDPNYQTQTTSIDEDVSADMNAEPTDSTLQAETEGANSELLATQPAAIDDGALVDMNDALAEDMPQNDVEDPNAELLAAQPSTTDSDEFETVAEVETENVNSEMQASTANQQPNQQHSSPDYQPLIAGEAEGSGAETVSTLQEKKKDSRGELLATQPGEVEVSENRFVVSASR